MSSLLFHFLARVKSRSSLEFGIWNLRLRPVGLTRIHAAEYPPCIHLSLRTLIFGIDLFVQYTYTIMCRRRSRYSYQHQHPFYHNSDYPPFGADNFTLAPFCTPRSSHRRTCCYSNNSWAPRNRYYFATDTSSQDSSTPPNTNQPHFKHLKQHPMAGLIIGAVALGVKKYDEHKEKKEKKRIELV